MAKKFNNISIYLSDEEEKLLVEFQRQYVTETGDVGLRKATLIKLLLMKDIQEPKAINRVARLRNLKL